ncbi:baculoviral IAP repeat-containing protein 7-B-like [Cloeon dipterum]|uniref:baculoviral IAP repeat-containing protein 7-B-like n=1 Tax=Cloeon dipterum TaxID=197152 RepID=UPI00322045F0
MKRLKDAINTTATHRRELEENPHRVNLIFSFSIHRLFSFPHKYLRKNFNALRKLAELGLYYVKENEWVEYLRCNFCSLTINHEELKEYFARGNENAEKEILERQNQFNCRLNSDDSKNVPMGKNFSCKNYKYEAHRLYSLLKKSDWLYVGPFSLAKSGFYYTGDGDNVRCVFCNLEVRGWEEGDTPDGEHQRWNPNCPFLRNRQSVQNIKIGDETVDLQHDSLSRIHLGASLLSQSERLRKYGPNLHLVRSTNLFLLTPQDLNIQDWYAPLNARFVTLKSRQDSFKNLWPRSHKQTSLELAQAGFFYTGIGDRVICFYCNLGLKDWDPNDDPFVQHCKWNSSCQYLLMRKGHSFVEKVLHGNENLEISATCAIRVGKRSDLKCLKCIKNNVSKLNLPCGHVAYCSECSEPSCTICNEEVIAEIHLPGFSDLQG